MHIGHCLSKQSVLIALPAQSRLGVPFGKFVWSNWKKIIGLFFFLENKAAASTINFSNDLLNSFVGHWESLPFVHQAF